MMLRPMDLWRCAILRQPIQSVLEDGIAPAALTWLPDLPRDSFRADPFGLWRNGRLHVFAETFDYRGRSGRIDVLIYDDALTLLECRPVLARPWHLSYPYVFEADGETWMLPEAYKSGTLTLYRARDFPFHWEPVRDLKLDSPAIDATPLFHNGTWWLFYAPSHHKSARLSHLHVAWSDRLTGPWQPHPANPVRIDRAGARPGGTPWLQAGAIVLPVQDCAATYGAAVAPLTITQLDERVFTATKGPRLGPPTSLAPYNDGLHTLAAAGPITLIDVKRMDASLQAKLRRMDGIVRQRMSRRAPPRRPE